MNSKVFFPPINSFLLSTELVRKHVCLKEIQAQHIFGCRCHARLKGEIIMKQSKYIDEILTTIGTISTKLCIKYHCVKRTPSYTNKRPFNFQKEDINDFFSPLIIIASCFEFLQISMAEGETFVCW